MLRILIIGCGDVGLRAARMLRGKARVYGLLRSPERAGELRAAGVIPVPGDLDDRRSLGRLAGLADVVFHFAPPPPEGEGDPRTRRLVAALSSGESTRRGASLPRTLIYVSTSGVYGDCAGAAVPETRPARPHNARAKRRQAAERTLRRWAADTGVGLAILRAPGIYARDRLPDARVRKSLPALLPADDIDTNHIHADDLAGLAVAAMFRAGRNRLYNAVDDSGLKMGDWFDVVADFIGVSRPPRLPKDEVMAAVTPAMRSFLSESRRLSNGRIKGELRYRLLYPNVRVALFEPPGKG